MTRLNADGSALVYSTYLGGRSSELGYAVAVGPDGSAYATGYTWSSDFPTTPGAFQTSCSGSCRNTDAFVTKLSADGSALVYSTFLGGNSNENGFDIALGVDGSAYVTGNTYSSNFPTTPGAYDTVCEITIYGYCFAAFVTKVTADGSALVYSTFLGGSRGAGGYGIAVGADGAAYITGSTASYDFPTTSGAYDTTCGTDGLCNYDGTSSYSDAILTKLSADGSALVYSTFLGGSVFEQGYGLALGADGSVYIAGLTNSTDFPITPGAFDPTCGCDPANFIYDAFVSRLSPDLVRMYVSDITPFYRPRGGRYLVGARITIQDANSAPVAGAAVTVNIDLPSGSQLTFTNTTNTTGRVIFRNLVRETGTYTFTVMTVSKYGWLYDPSLNIESCGEPDACGANAGAVCRLGSPAAGRDRRPARAV